MNHQDSFTQEPQSAALAAQALLVAASSGSPLGHEQVSRFRAVAHLWAELDADQKWAFWSNLVALDNPSSALRVLHQCGWEDNFPELAAVRDVPQDPHWHTEGAVHVHSQEAADFAARQATADDLSDFDRQVAVLAALCHDFGKSTHTQCRSDGRVTSIGHDRAGGPKARSFLKSVGAPKHVVDAVVVLVNEHMCHVQPAPTARALTRLEERLAQGGATLEQLVRLFDADTGGRGSASQVGAGQAWLDARRQRDEHRAAKPRPDFNGDYLVGLGYSSP